jgi:hypothetical protein
LSGTRLELSRSWVLATVILALHAAAALSVLAVMRTALGYALAAALLALGAAAAWARALHGSRRSVRAIELSGNEMVLELRDATRHAAEPGARRHVSRMMVALHVRRPMRRTILVTRDMLDADLFRRLRLWALWGKLPGEQRGVAHKQLPA